MRRLAPLIVAALALLLLVGLAYRDATSNGFHFDDDDNIVDHRPLHLEALSLDGLAGAAGNAFLPTRPLPSVTFAIDWWRGGGQAAAFQQTNVLLHAANALLVFALLLLAGRSARPPDATASPWALAAPLLAAALWAVHPIQVQTVTYVVQRMAELAALFTLLSVIFYVRGRTAPRRQAPWLAGAVVAFALGALCKENAWVTPALWWLAEFGLCRGGRPLLATRADRLLFALPFGLAVLVILDVASGVGPLARHFLPGYEVRDFTLAERLLTQPRVILFHVSQILWPAPGRFSVEHDFLASTGVFSPPSTAAALLAVLAWCAGGLLALMSRHGRIAGFWMLWLVVGLVPESSVPPLEMVFEHRMYLPGVALFALAGMAAAPLFGAATRPPRLIAAAAGGLAVLALSWITPAQVRLWSSHLTLYENAVGHAPTSGRAWAGYGAALLEAGRGGEAGTALRRAVDLDPRQYGAWEKLAILSLDAGDLAAAEQALRVAMRLRGAHHSILNHLGEVTLRGERPQEAAELFSAAVAAMPTEPIYRWNLALTLERLGQCVPAVEQWRAYLRLERDQRERATVEAHLREGCAPPP